MRRKLQLGEQVMRFLETYPEELRAAGFSDGYIELFSNQILRTLRGLETGRLRSDPVPIGADKHRAKLFTAYNICDDLFIGRYSCDGEEVILEALQFQDAIWTIATSAAVSAA